jgi:hypothetical protein
MEYATSVELVRLLKQSEDPATSHQAEYLVHAVFQVLVCCRRRPGLCMYRDSEARPVCLAEFATEAMMGKEAMR